MKRLADGPSISAPTTTGALLSILLAACGSSSPASTVDDAGGVDTQGDGAAGTDAVANRDADLSDDAPAAPGTTGADGDADQRPADAAAADGAPTADSGGTVMSVYVTFYGWADNDPPGGAIAYPKSDGYPTLHETAGGTGTYADPITFATDKAEFPVGTILYVPFIEKYVMMEDDCAECDSDWTSGHKWHIDLWMNSNAAESSSSLVSCEDRWTRDSTSIEMDPPADRTVTPAPLFDPSTNICRTTP
jgi:3D (Asp-Asp-Asp) domain-containing protein